MKRQLIMDFFGPYYDLEEDYYNKVWFRYTITCREVIWAGIKCRKIDIVEDDEIIIEQE